MDPVTSVHSGIPFPEWYQAGLYCSLWVTQCSTFTLMGGLHLPVKNLWTLSCFILPTAKCDCHPVYCDKGTPPKKGGRSSFTVTELSSSHEPKGQRPLSLLNIGHVVLVLNETNTDVCMYTSRIYSSRYLDTLLYKVELNVHWNYTGLYTNVTIDLRRLSDVITRKGDNCSWQE